MARRRPTSHRAEMELMLEMRCARKAFAVSLESSALHRFVVSTCAVGTHLVRVRRWVRRRVRVRRKLRCSARGGSRVARRRWRGPW